MREINPNIICWYKNGCPCYSSICQKTCHRYLEMNFLINNCGMPNASKYIKPIVPDSEDVDAFDKLLSIKNNVKSFVENGRTLYISSAYSKNGKTTWALKILYKYFDEIWNGNGFNVRGYFIYTPEFLNNLKSFNYKETEEYQEIKESLLNSDLVIWDDVSLLTLNPTDQNNLSIFLNKRSQSDGKANIFTGYHLGNDLVNQVGKLISKKITDDYVVEFKKPGRTNEENEIIVSLQLQKQMDRKEK